jgi:formate dehydrogenase assembly factor FdhD
MKSAIRLYHDDLTKSYASATHKIFAIDQSGKRQELMVVGELPLTLKVDGFEIVRLMTIGNQPKALALGYLRDQGFIEKINEIASVAVDWENETVNVVTRNGAVMRRHRTKLSTVSGIKAVNVRGRHRSAQCGGCNLRSYVA